MQASPLSASVTVEEDISQEPLMGLFWGLNELRTHNSAWHLDIFMSMLDACFPLSHVQTCLELVDEALHSTSGVEADPVPSWWGSQSNALTACSAPLSCSARPPLPTPNLSRGFIFPAIAWGLLSSSASSFF